MVRSEIAPKISVYISTHNRLDKLKRAIKSVLNQDYNDFELLVCDDASSDGTKEYMQALVQESNKIKYFRNEENKGACATRNLGVFSAKGEYIAGLDDDDEFTSNRLSYFLENWKDHYSFLCCNFKNVYPNGESEDYYKEKRRGLTFNYKNMLFENEASNQIFTLTRRLKKIGGFDPSVRRLQDWDTWLRLSYEFGEFLRLPHSTYIMHHDHEPHEIRVSQNAKITESLVELVNRNKHIYSGKEAEYMLFLVSNMRKDSTLSESLYWSICKFNPKYIIKYLLQ